MHHLLTIITLTLLFRKHIQLWRYKKCSIKIKLHSDYDDDGEHDVDDGPNVSKGYGENLQHTQFLEQMFPLKGIGSNELLRDLQLSPFVLFLLEV